MEEPPLRFFNSADRSRANRNRGNSLVDISELPAQDTTSPGHLTVSVLLWSRTASAVT
uniref:Uncharacterized protein n=1 Tax=Anguilla anguilla TaxID=7936 RepID=A0A0E9U8U9_ANGAN